MQKHKTSFTAITLVIIKQLRLERNLTQAQVSVKLGKVTSAYNKIENGESLLTVAELFKIGSVFQMNPSDILHRVEIFSISISQKGWSVTPTLPIEEDDLIKHMGSYRPVINAQSAPFSAYPNGFFDHALQNLIQHCVVN